MKFHWKVALAILITLNSAEICFASEALIRPPWLIKFMEKKWQQVRGLSCGTNMFYFKGDQYITRSIGVDSIFYTITKVDDKSRYFAIKTFRFIEDVSSLSQMFPQYGDRISETSVYTFRLLSDDKVEITRRYQVIDISAMAAGGSLSYKPAVIETQVVFDCE
jgi:hypothetical protein